MVKTENQIFDRTFDLKQILKYVNLMNLLHKWLLTSSYKDQWYLQIL